jgi:hypothetical protein
MKGVKNKASLLLLAKSYKLSDMKYLLMPFLLLFLGCASHSSARRENNTARKNDTCDCSKLFGNREDKVEGTKISMNLKDLVFHDSTNDVLSMNVYIMIDPTGKHLGVILQNNTSRIVKSGYPVKILFADGSRTSFDGMTNSDNDLGQYMLTFTRHPEDTVKYPGVITNSEIIYKTINTIRFYGLDKDITDIVLKYSDGVLLQQNLECAYKTLQ